MVASGAVGSVIYGLLQPSPTNPSTTLLNADIALQFVPAMLFGVGVGAHFHTRNLQTVEICRLLQGPCVCEHARHPQSSTVLSSTLSLLIVAIIRAAGVLFNPLCPEWLQTALLTVGLLIVVRKTFAKGFRQWNEEQKALEKSCVFVWPAILPPPAVKHKLMGVSLDGSNHVTFGRKQWTLLHFARSEAHMKTTTHC